MIDISAIYRNPLIPEYDYYVQLIEVRRGITDQGRPLLQVILQLADIYRQHSKAKLSVNIHNTPDADCIYEAFRESFAIGEDGKPGRRFALVRVRHCQYGQTDYAKVIFKRQKQMDLKYAARFEKMEQREEAAIAAEAKKKAEIEAKKLAEKQAYEARFGKRGRGRPRLGDGTGNEEVQFE